MKRLWLICLGALCLGACGRNPVPPTTSSPATPAAEEIPAGSFRLSIEDVVSSEEELQKNVRVKLPAIIKGAWPKRFGFGTIEERLSGIGHVHERDRELVVSLHIVEEQE